jgi:orotidine-5'-phosphate decarboxylase
MNSQQLFEQVKIKNSFLCVGLDTDKNKLPEILKNSVDPMFEFNKKIVDATINYTIAYKINIAFYEEQGADGWKSLEKTVSYVRDRYPEAFLIADAKRGDIGNTTEMYAKTYFQTFNFDAVTIAPYMGEDSVQPFLQHPNKWGIILALTSNPSSKDFQLLKSGDKYLFQHVIETSKAWGSEDNTMYVVGATQASMLETIRKQIPNHFLLIPGVGQQGGSLSEVAKYGMNSRCGLLVNSSRAIIYADVTENFAVVAGQEAKKVQQEMETLLKEYMK